MVKKKEEKKETQLETLHKESRITRICPNSNEEARYREILAFDKYDVIQVEIIVSRYSSVRSFVLRWDGFRWEEMYQLMSPKTSKDLWNDEELDESKFQEDRNELIGIAKKILFYDQ